MSEVTVVLYGDLYRPENGRITVQADTVAKALELVTRQLPQFQPTAHGRVRVEVIDYETEEKLFEYIDGECLEIHVVPQLAGGKNALTQILVGVALIGASFIPGVGPLMASMMVKMGAQLIIGGILAMLAPSPETDQGGQSNKYLGTPRNTVKIGTRIAILYGEYRWGGHYLAFDINAVEYSKEDNDDYNP